MKDIFNNDMFDDIPDNESEMFSMDDFEIIISKFNMKPHFSLYREDWKIIINESWSSTKNRAISANRVYEFDPGMIEIIPEIIRRDVLESALEIYVNDENYEEAAIVRDVISEIK